MVIRVFNGDKWRRKGYDCKHPYCKNDCFFEEVEVIRGYVHDHDVVIDVRFKSNGFFSKGHFVTGIKLH